MGQRAAGPAAGGAAATDISDHELVTLYGLLLEGCVRTERRVRVERVAGVDLPGPWFEVLVRLLRTPGRRLPMTRLAHDVSLTSGGFTKLADRMAAAGLIDRQPCPGDRRVTYTVLTPRGARLAEEGHRRHAALLRRHFLAPLGADRADQLAALMQVLRDANSDPGEE
ncbi:MarR family winged helix-turn-helix transcriptional regulator [Streptacidiphilus sp. ASG 303]|uniref:MarR family winged helix-turn-helix transcriptional regulator n=1 Tax=Streptomycetaceae TaxID=2062 RepID=UPI001E65855B|nr:MarR family transcriptional regulator [Streptacidiphilus sp. ASG 303]MCD0482846.1 MarR family transcriptional regulator [Streptacidiphilus sp. ASG 303]